MIRFEECVPRVYTSESRDFQLMCRLYDLIYSTSFSSQMIEGDILNPIFARDNILEYFAHKVGFFPKSEVNDVTLRYIISAFPEMIKYKGTKKAILMAINAVLKSEFNSFIVNTPIVEIYKNNEYSGYVINLFLPSTIKNENILRELLEYVMPTGFDLSITYFRSIPQGTDFLTKIKVGQVVNLGWIKVIDMSSVYSTKKVINSPFKDYLSSYNLSQVVSQKQVSKAKSRKKSSKKVIKNDN